MIELSRYRSRCRLLQMNLLVTDPSRQPLCMLGAGSNCCTCCCRSVAVAKQLPTAVD